MENDLVQTKQIASLHKNIGFIPLSKKSFGFNKKIEETPREKAVKNSPMFGKYMGEVESDIQSRTKSLQQSEEAQRNQFTDKSPREVAMNVASPNYIGKQALNQMSSLWSRGEAAVANPLLAAQRGEKDVGKLVGESIKGIKGERIGELGDIPRSVGIPKPVAAALGSFGMMGVVNAVSSLSKRFNPKFMTDKWLHKQSQDVRTAVVDSRKQVSKMYNDIYTPQTLETPVAGTKVAKSLEFLPKDMIDDLGINFTDDVTVGQIKQLRTDILTDKINASTFSKPARFQNVNSTQRILTKVVKNLKNVIKDSVDDGTRKAIEKVDPMYTDVMRKGGKIINMVYDPKYDFYKTNQLASTFSSSSKAGERVLFNEMKKYAPKLAEVAKNMKSYAKRQAIKRAVKQAAPYMAAAGAGGAGVFGAGKLIAGALE